MSFNTYVINLEKDKVKWSNMKRMYKNVKNINLTRFDAIYGRNVKEELLNRKMTRLCRQLSPDSVIGCGLSHLLLVEHFMNNDPNDFCLILEDDAEPQYDDLYDRIIDIVKEMKTKDWDIIRLFCIGLNGYNKHSRITKTNIIRRVSTGSNAAYLISKKGANKLRNIKLHWHIDLQYNLIPNMNIYISDYPLFNCDFETSSTSECNELVKKLFKYRINDYSPPISWILGEKVMCIRPLNINITVLHLVIILIIIIVISLTRHKK